jgi:hypothetical protein
MQATEVLMHSENFVPLVATVGRVEAGHRSVDAFDAALALW